jgi:hypothetical protein
MVDVTQKLLRETWKTLISPSVDTSMGLHSTAWYSLAANPEKHHLFPEV